MSGKRLELSRVHLRSPLGTVSGEGSIATAGEAASQIRAVASALDAGAVMRLFNLPYAIASRVDGRVAATWPGLTTSELLVRRMSH